MVNPVLSKLGLIKNILRQRPSSFLLYTDSKICLLLTNFRYFYLLPYLLWLSI